MAGEAKKVYGAQFTLSSGSDAAIASAAVGTPGGTNPYSTTQTGDYPNLALVLTGGFAATATQNGTIDLSFVPQNVDGTTDAKDITATYRPYWRASFIVDAVSSSQTYYCEAYDVPKEAKVMIYNAAGQQLSANYTLKATPFTLGPA
jgi:hypothetical protein